MKIIDLDKPFWQWILLLLLSFVWGSSFILMKKGLESYSSNQVASLRLVLTALVLLPIVIRNFKKIKSKYWLYLFIAGLLGNGIPAFLFTAAETKISSSITGMLNSLVPLFTVIIGLLFFGSKFNIKRFSGVILGLIGAIGLLQVQGISIENDDFLYSLLVVLATICYATNINFIKRNLESISSLNITAFAFFLIGIPSAIYLFSTDFAEIFIGSTKAKISFIYIAILAIFGTAIAVILFNILIKKVSPVYASSVTYIIPIFAIMWGYLDKESILPLHIFWIIIILSGVYLVNRENLKRKRKNKISVKN